MVSQYDKHGRYVKIFGVTSHSNPNNEYTIAVTDKGVWSCSCPWWIHHVPRPTCKHILEAKKFELAGKLSIPLKPLSEKMMKVLTRFSAIEV